MDQNEGIMDFWTKIHKSVCFRKKYISKTFSSSKHIYVTSKENNSLLCIEMHRLCIVLTRLTVLCWLARLFQLTFKLPITLSLINADILSP